MQHQLQFSYIFYSNIFQRELIFALNIKSFFRFMIIIYIFFVEHFRHISMRFSISCYKRCTCVKEEKTIRDARRVFRAAVARTRNNGIPTSRLISKTNFRDVNETKSDARRGGICRGFSSNCQRLEITLSGRVWQDRGVAVPSTGAKCLRWKGHSPTASMPLTVSLRASSFRFLNCKLFDRKPKTTRVH